jgi:uncharacterized protein YndB with AHSA1/START domain
MAPSMVRPDTALQLTRTFAASRDQVFRAWTEPEQLKQWWGPPGYEALVVEVDLRAGGRYRIGMRELPSGEVFYLSGVYEEVQPPERLVYTWRWEAESADSETRVTVEFRDRGRATEVVLTHEMFPTRPARDQHQAGWTGCLEKFATCLAGRF